MTILKVEQLSKQFGGLTAVSGFNVELQRGELVGLIGPNGSGKTTIFNMISGLYKPTSGTIQFEGRNTTGLRADRVTALGIARTFQNIRLFSHMSVLDNVMVGRHLRLQSPVVAAAVGLPQYGREEQGICQESMELLRRVELAGVAHEQAGSLPYGLQRKLEIARALATQPRLLLLDEPAAGMNPSEVHGLMGFVLSIMHEFMLTVFLVEHHMRMIMGICPRILVLDHGVTIAQGSPEQIQNDPKVIEAYLGAEDDDA